MSENMKDGKRIPFADVPIGGKFRHRGTEFVKINGDEAKKVEHDGYCYANFNLVWVKL